LFLVKKEKHSLDTSVALARLILFAKKIGRKKDGDFINRDLMEKQKQ
ncbi:unnamed protein product, partial [marine sediment metagenome]